MTNTSSYGITYSLPDDEEIVHLLSPDCSGYSKDEWYNHPVYYLNLYCQRVIMSPNLRTPIKCFTKHLEMTTCQKCLDLYTKEQSDFIIKTLERELD